MPGVFRTRSLVCENKKHTSKSTTGTPNIPAFPARWFYDFLRALPGDRAFLSPSPRNAEHCRELISASRYQDHTASSSAKRALVRRARRVHHTPRQRSVTIAKRPSSRARDARKMLLICPTAQVKGLRHFNATGKSLGQDKSCQVKSNCSSPVPDAAQHLLWCDASGERAKVWACCHFGAKRTSTSRRCLLNPSVNDPNSDMR
jgi:hypothetical protein